MTIIAKDGASTAPDSFSTTSDGDATKSSYPNPPASSDPQAPPSYAETFANDGLHGEPAEGTSTVELPKSSNYVNVFKQNGAISGTWVIDTNLQIPAAFIETPKNGDIPNNLSLVTKTGAIDATVYLKTVNGKKAHLNIDTQCGRVIVLIPSRLDHQAFKLNAVTRTGAMFIRLPRDYRGPLKHTVKCGSVYFSDEIQKNITTFGSEASFVGHWENEGFTDYDGWLGDEVYTMSSCGNITFSYADEVQEEGEAFGEKIQKAVDRTINTLFGWVALR